MKLHLTNRNTDTMKPNKKNTAAVDTPEIKPKVSKQVLINAAVELAREEHITRQNDHRERLRTLKADIKDHTLGEMVRILNNEHEVGSLKPEFNVNQHTNRDKSTVTMNITVPLSWVESKLRNLLVEYDKMDSYIPDFNENRVRKAIIEGLKPGGPPAGVKEVLDDEENCNVIREMLQTIGVLKHGAPRLAEVSVVKDK